MTGELERRVRRRAGERCEYCRIPQSADPLPLHVDHVIARQHGGQTRLQNLALACAYCNGHKGPNIASIDPVTKRLTPLFNPRADDWSKHFRWSGPRLIGLTPAGRATILILAINDGINLSLRRGLIAEGLLT